MANCKTRRGMGLIWARQILHGSFDRTIGIVGSICLDGLLSQSIAKQTPSLLKTTCLEQNAERISRAVLSASNQELVVVWSRNRGRQRISFDPYETHSAVKRPNAVLCKRMRSATDKSKINNGCMQKHKREKNAALFLQ